MIRKVIEFIIAKRIAYLAEIFQLLPATHIGGRKGRSTEHGIYYLIKRIYAAWNKGEVATILLLDISGVYDKVLYRRLLYNLKK